MIDPRFYEVSGPLKASAIAALAGSASIRGDDGRGVSSLAPVSRSGASDLTFLEDEAGAVAAAQAGVVFATEAVAARVPDGPTVILVKHPRSAFAKAAAGLARVRELEAGQPNIHPSAKLHASVVVEPGAVIGAGVAIGADTRICANAVIGPGVQIGVRSTIGANTSVRCALLGDGVRLLPGAVVGETGFGLAADGSGAVLSPHFGRVIMQNGVSLGANSSIDRGFLEDTVIGEGTHIDNVCHIGHNCRVGSNVVMAAYAGISGSVTIEDNVQFGGRVGLRDHIHIGRNARLAAGAAVISDVPAGETWAGYPARPMRTWLRELAWLSRAAQKRSPKQE